MLHEACKYTDSQQSLRNPTIESTVVAKNLGFTVFLHLFTFHAHQFTAYARAIQDVFFSEIYQSLSR